MEARVLRERILAAMVSHPIAAEHTEFAHFYRYHPSGALLASVTTRAGAFSTDTKKLQRWAARLAAEHVIEKYRPGMNDKAKDVLVKAAIEAHNDAFKDAGGVGTLIHGACEEYTLDWMKNGVRDPDARRFARFSTDYRVMAGVRSLEKFMTDFEAEPVMSEMLVAHPDHGFAGTLDSLQIVRRFQGEPCELLCIVDYKSSNQIKEKPAYAMQTVAYLKAFEFLTGVRIDKLLVLRLSKEKCDYDLEEVVDHDAAFEAFIHAGRVYDWLWNGSKKSVDVFAKKKLTI